MITEKKAGGAGFGASRFLVRGRGYLELDRAAALRPAYDEYPERYPLEPAFPQPGRRGGSAAPKATSGAPGASATSVAGAAAYSAPTSAPSGSVYPLPRPRTGDISVGGSAAVGVVSAGGQAAVNCLPDGDSFRFGFATPLGTSEVKVQGPVSRPFRVVRLQLVHGGGSNVDVDIGAKVASDNLTTNGVNTSGAPLLQTVTNTGQADPQSGRGEYFPNKLVSSVPSFLKAFFRNGTAGALDAEVVVDIEYL